MEHICGNVYMGVILYKIMISELFFKLKKSKKKMSFLDIFTISPLQRPREISQNVSGLYYVRRGACYKIHICAKLYYLGRAKVFSSVATDFGSWTKLTCIGACFPLNVEVVSPGSVPIHLKTYHNDPIIWPRSA